MKVTFLGVGEACDPTCPNTSILVETSAGGNFRQVLLDCGFTTPHLYFARAPEADQLDGLWISHFHGDHFFGVPLLQLRLWEMGRRKPLIILGQEGTARKINQALELAFPGFEQKLNYSIQFQEMEPEQARPVLGLQWQTAANHHSQRSLAVKLDDGERKIFYSGDGRPTEETLALAHGCDLIIHEAFHLEEETAGHGSVRGCLHFARRAGVAHLGLVHLERHTRGRRHELERMVAEEAALNVFVPQPGDEFHV